MRFYVTISHLSDKDLEFYGWQKVRENADFRIYRDVSSGDEQIVDNSGVPFLMVEDLNDAQAMSKDRILQAPDRSD